MATRQSLGRAQRATAVVLLSLLASSVLSVTAAPAPDATIAALPGGLVRASNLRRDAENSGARGPVFILLFSLPDCHYCEEVRDNYLRPLSQDPAYADRLIVRELRLDDDGEGLKDFFGASVSASGFAARYAVRVAPTVLFVDAHGRSIGKALVGAGLAGFYGAYFDAALQSALMQVSERDSTPPL